MKRLTMVAWLPLLAALLVFLSCPTEGGGDDDPPGPYDEFYNYPDGRTDPGGLLTIQNSATAKALLFTDSVAAANYIGTVEGLSSVKVKLPEEKFYTIVAVDEANFKEKQAQASQYSDLTYYSNRQPFVMSVRPDSMYGAGKWIIKNSTSYWVSMRKVDGSGGNWAVVAPNALRTEVPIEVGKNYDYTPHFFKELKHNGKVIAVVESDQVSASDTVTTTEQRTTFTTTIGSDVLPPSANLNPAILFVNNGDKSVRVYSGLQGQLSPGGEPGEDFVVGSGDEQIFTQGISVGSKTNAINFESLSWSSRVYVSDDITMEKDKVYRIVLSGNSSGYSTTVTVEDASEYFN
jgi:hypothetical protein